MNKVKHLLIACALCLGLLGPTGQTQADNDYGVITIENPTRFTLYYQFKWGNGDWVSSCLQPGCYTCHYHRLDDGRAPTPYVRFDNGVGNFKDYRLSFYGAWRVNYHSGKKYRFNWSGPYLDLYAR